MILSKHLAGLVQDKGLSITFMGELAVDDGGPPCEFFRLLMFVNGKDTSFFCGSEGKRKPTHNFLACSDGGPGPHFLCKTVARYLCNEPVITPELDVLDH